MSAEAKSESPMADIVRLPIDSVNATDILIDVPTTTNNNDIIIYKYFDLTYQKVYLGGKPYFILLRRLDEVLKRVESDNANGRPIASRVNMEPVSLALPMVFDNNDRHCADICELLGVTLVGIDYKWQRFQVPIQFVSRVVGMIRRKSSDDLAHLFTPPICWNIVTNDLGKPEPVVLHIPEFIQDPIPKIKKELYDVMGLKFIETSKNGLKYYVYEPVLESVCKKHGFVK
jgi:hypothetical protein